MEGSKTITIYDIPVEPTDKLAELETSSMNPQPPSTQSFKEVPFIESSIPSILLKNIIFNCIPIETPTSAGSHWSTQVQFPMPILTFISGTGFVIRGPGDTIHLSGIVFDSTRSYLQLPHVFYTWRNSSIRNQALSGVLALRSLAARYKNSKVPRVANFFTHDIVFSQLGDSHLCQALDKKTVVLRFHSDDDAIKKITMLQNFMTGRQLHYGLSLGLSMRALSDIVKRGVSFKSHSVRASNVSPNANRNQLAALELIDTSQVRAISAARAVATIYSTDLDDIYIRILTKNMTPASLVGQKSGYENARSQKSLAKTRIAADIKSRMDLAWREAIARREFQKPLGELSASEMEVINASHTREVARSNALVRNKCPHVGHYRKVMASRATTFDVVRWNKLREFLDLSNVNAATPAELPPLSDMIQCNQCRLAAICPHNWIMFEYTDKFWGNDDSRALTWVTDNFTSPDSPVDGKYCRICGELLVRISVESESWLSLSKGNDSESTDQLGILIAAEVSETLSANLDLSHSAVNRSAITSSIANAIDPWIRHYDLKLRRIKTNTELDIALSLGLIIAIYAMMGIAHIIALAGSTGSGISIKGIAVRGEKDLKLLHTLFNNIYKLLTAQRSAVIEKIIAFTPDRIKKIMTRAYGQISGAPVVIETVTIEYHMDLVTDNPYYHMLAYLWRMGELLAAPHSRGLVPMKHSDPEEVIGVKIVELNKMRNFFAHVKLAPAWKPADNTDVSHDWIDYCWKSFSTYASRLISGTSAMDEVNAPAIWTEYNKLMELRSSLTMGDAAVRDEKAKYLYGRRNLGRSAVMRRAAYDFTTPDDLTRVFCPGTGKLHEWKIFVLDSPLAEFKSSDFKSMAARPGKFKSLKCINCGYLTCGPTMQTKSATSSAVLTKSATSSAVLTKSRQQNSNVAAEPISNSTDAIKLQSRDRGFFSYYKVRCPKGWFHTFENGTCSKCGIKSKLTSDEAATYLKTYLTAYESRNVVARDKQSVIISADERARRDPGMIVSRKVPKSIFKPWTSQNTSITTVSKTWAQLPYNLLINIGMISGTHWQPIITGKINPSNSATDALFMKQAAAVSGYVSLIVVSYNRFSTCATRGMHPDLNEFCERRGDEVRELKMLDLGEFYAERQWRADNDKPSGFSNWCINQMCNFLLKIDSFGPVAKRFASLMADTIAASEMNMSKSLVYKNIMIAAAKSTANLDALGDEVDAPETDVEAKEFIKSIASSGESFSTGDMDIDDVAASRGDDDI